eukprot:TRINITY_DN8621_c0_g1_i2.p1 TRINITY_DN8621_c0_g1~~TRINITY_DN8621_c0_g1_i2.p1  ORF type:complete len:505 (-),score=66.35 TRINITY_DN8621_c0_g1_i2:5-1519(-)
MEEEVKLNQFSVREKQTQCILRMLGLNNPVDAEGYWKDVWKILIFDAHCRDILTVLLKVSDLRKSGVTLHMMLSSPRQPIPDVPAIYFVMPTKENVKRICEDCNNQLYDQIHLNFASSISRPLLEEIATATLESDTVSRIAKVYDQYTNFISLDDDLFILNQTDSYIAFHDPSVTDDAAIKNIEDTVDALFSVIITMGVVPVIRCPKGDAAEMIARGLDQKLREHLSNPQNLLSESSSSFHRPLLVLLDRNLDLSVMLAHAWTYQALVHDIFKMNLNRVQLELIEKNVPVKRSFDLGNNDFFWRDHSGTNFPQVAVEIESMMADYKAKLQNAPSESDFDPSEEDPDAVLKKTKDIGQYVSAIPKLQLKQKLLDMHTRIAMQLLNIIKDRGLDTYCSLEESIMSKTLSNKEVLSAITTNKGSAEDKLRLFLIYFLSNPQKLQADELKQCLSVLEEAGCNMKPFYYLQSIKVFNENWAANVQPIGSKTSSIPVSYTHLTLPTKRIV